MADRIRSSRTRIPLSLLVVFGLGALPVAPSWAGPAKTAPSPAADAEAAEAGNYKLTLAMMNKVEKAFRGFAAAAEADPALRERLNSLEPPDGDAESAVVSIDDAARRMESIPEFGKIVEDVGVTMREVLLFSYVLAGTAIASSLTGGDAPAPPDAPPALAENLRWYRENQAPIRGFLEQMERLSRDEEAREGVPDAWSGGDADSAASDEE